MKKMFYLLLLLFTGSLFAQPTISTPILPTSEEEYNYLSKGYKIQLESGLDMKKGYYIEDMPILKNHMRLNIDNVIKDVVRQSAFKLLFREGEKRPCAILLIQTRKDNNVQSYFCIPSYSSDLWPKFYEDFFKNFKDVSGKISKYELELLSAQYSYYYHSLQILSYCLTTDHLKQ